MLFIIDIKYTSTSLHFFCFLRYAFLAITEKENTLSIKPFIKSINLNTIQMALLQVRNHKRSVAGPQNVTVPADLVPYMEAYIKFCRPQLGPKTSAVFVSSRTGGELTSSGFASAVKNKLIKAGASKDGFCNQLMHQSAVTLVSKSISIKVVINR